MNASKTVIQPGPVDQRAIMAAVGQASKLGASELFLLFPEGPFPQIGRLDRARIRRHLRGFRDVRVGKLGKASKNPLTRFLGASTTRIPDALAGYRFLTVMPADAALVAFGTGRSNLGLELASAATGGRGFASGNSLDRIGFDFGNRFFRFRMLPSTGAVLTGGDLTENTVIPSRAAGTGVVGVAQSTFNGAQMRTLYAGANLRWIGDAAFQGCPNLEQVLLPDGLTYLGAGAFRGCGKLSYVRLPASLTEIGMGAFAEAPPSLIVEVTEGSTAHTFAVENALQVVFGKSAPVPVPVHQPKLLTEKNAVYLTLPGGGAQLLAAAGQLGRRRLIIPEEVSGHPVVGITTGAVRDLKGTEVITLPRNLQWVDTGAFEKGASLDRVTRLDRVPVVLPGAVPQGVRVVDSGTPPRIPDFDRVYVSPRMIARILGVPLTETLLDVADQPVTGISMPTTYTVRAGNMCFVRIRRRQPELVDPAIKRGAKLFVGRSTAKDSKGNEYPTLLVPNATEAFVTVTGWIGRQYPARRIALTGSVGKTTVKDMVRRVAETEYDTLYSKGNENGPAGVSRYVQEQSFQTQVYIQEAGAGKPRQVENDGRMIWPDAFMITNIGNNHVGDYNNDPEALLGDKLSLDRFLPEDGVAFVNYDDQKLREQKLIHPVISYAVNNAEADYQARDIVAREGLLEFIAIERETGVEVPIAVRAFGDHNVGNALLAFAVGRWLGISPERIAQGIYSYKGTGLRQNLTVLAGHKVLVDCYNASEVSAKSVATALQTIAPGPGGFRYLAFADIDDKLGDVTEEVHRRVGKNFAAQPDIDRFFLFGKHAGWAAEELEAAGVDYFHTEDRTELVEELRRVLTPQDVVAFKGGQHMAQSINIDHIFGSAFIMEDGAVLRNRGRFFTEGGLRFRHIDEYGLAFNKLTAGFAADNLVVPGYVDGEPVILVERAAARTSNIRSVRVESPVRTIDQRAFAGCNRLREVALPETLLFMGEGAFAGCRALTELEIPQGVRTIEDEAFARCTNLQKIRIPSSVVTFGENVFKDCHKLTVQCQAGSAAETYCRAAGIMVETVN